MNKLISFKDYCAVNDINERSLYRYIETGKVQVVKMGGERCIVEQNAIDGDGLKLILKAKKEEWNNRIIVANNIYSANGRSTDETTAIINEVEKDVITWKKFLMVKIPGYDKRSLQRKVKLGKIDRQMRSDKFSIRNKVLAQPGVLEKTLELICEVLHQASMLSVEGAVDRAIYYAKQNEEYYEVAAVNIYTLRRQVTNHIKQSGFRNLHEFTQHYNLFKKKYAYTKGAFTHDTEFMAEYQVDDRQSDIAGCWVWNEASGKFELKKAMHWQVIETTTMMVLGRQLKSTPFTEEDLVKMMMGVFKTYGLPKRRVVYDNGLMNGSRCQEFFAKVGVLAEPSKPYSPTDKAMRERMNRFQKDESDNYQENFVGATHPTEGRHRGDKLSPEQINELFSEAEKRYDNFFQGFYMDKPRELGLQGVDHLRDNTGRVTIRQAFDYLYQTHEPIMVSNIKLRYAYCKNDVVKSFDNYYMLFKKELYMPTKPLSLVLNDPAYKYIVAYDPMDLNKIDIYADQAILDKLTGDLISKGQYVATLEAISTLDADEKKQRVTVYNKQVKKAMKALVTATREKYSTNGKVYNDAVNSDGALVNIRKQQEAQVEDIIKRSLPIDRIETAIQKTGTERIDINESLSEESFNSLDDLNLD